MNSIVLVIIGALVLIIGYRLYGYFIASKVLVLAAQFGYFQVHFGYL